MKPGSSWPICINSQSMKAVDQFINLGSGSPQEHLAENSREGAQIYREVLGEWKRISILVDVLYATHEWQP